MGPILDSEGLGFCWDLFKPRGQSDLGAYYGDSYWLPLKD